MGTSAERQNPAWQLSAVLGLAAATALVLLCCATKHGIGLWGDSLDYVSAARSIAAGHGAYSLGTLKDWEPLTAFPPFYPVLLAGSSIFGVDPLVGARAIQALLFAAMVVLVGKLTFRATASLAAVALACAMALASLAQTFATAQSEGTFIVLLLVGLGLLAQHLQQKNPRQLTVAALTLGMALLTRYAGASLLAVAAGALLLYPGPSQRSGRRRIVETLFFLALALAPTAFWTWHLGSVHAATSRQIVFHPPEASTLKQALETIGHWFGIKSPKAAPYVAAAALLLGLAYMAWRFLPQHRRQRKLPGGPLVLVLLTFALVYVPFLIFSISFVDAATPLNARILSPLLPPMLIVAIALFWEWSPQLVKFRPALLAFILVVCLGIVYHAAMWATAARSIGLGYNSVAWHESDILQWVKQLPPQTPIYSNGKDVIYFLTGRITHALPRIQMRKKHSAMSASRINEQMHAMEKDLAAHDGVVIYFAGIERDDYLASAQVLAQHMPLQPKPKLSFINSQNHYAAGEVYGLTPAAATQPGGTGEPPSGGATGR